MNFSAKKRFGQNFLYDKNIAAKIVSAANIQKGDYVWEIGPGKGILTDELLKKDCRLTCFEIDRDIIPHLVDKYSQFINDRSLEDILEHPQDCEDSKRYAKPAIVGKAVSPSLHLINEDVLKTDWDKLLTDMIGIEDIGNAAINRTKKSQVILVANIPYNITSPLLFKLCEYRNYFKTIVLMIQKEVAERISSLPGRKSYGVLSLKIQYSFHIQNLFKVPPHLFRPQPNVDSTVVKLLPRDNEFDAIISIDRKLFWKIVEASFHSRRKTLRNNLKAILEKPELDILDKMLLLKFNSQLGRGKPSPYNNAKSTDHCRGNPLQLPSQEEESADLSSLISQAERYCNLKGGETVNIKKLSAPRTKNQFNLSNRGEELSEEDFICLFSCILAIRCRDH